MSLEMKLGQINEYVNKSKDIYIMMHLDSDLDAMGSAIGLSDFFARKRKDCYIINDDKRMEVGVRKLYNTFKDKLNFIKSTGLLTKITSDDLLIVVDTNNPRLISNRELLDKFSTVINIDHHDKTEEMIEAELQIIDEDASSACEMIAQYVKDVISDDVATALLAGIVLDTNGFAMKTTAKTFEVSSSLMDQGANNTEVQYLLKQDLKEYIQRQKVITNVKTIGGIAVSKGMKRTVYKREDIAKIADSLLFFNGIKASFVVGRTSKEEVAISARSYGKVNVGKLLKKFGGGGDEEMAAAKIVDGDIDEVYNELIDKIKEIR